MKIFDCITYFDEPLLFDLRLNILNDYVDEFVVCEATYTHSGKKKKINFNKDNYPDFKKKITHIIVDKQPDDLVETEHVDKSNNDPYRSNAIKRIAKQRNAISSFFNKNNANDWVIYSDSDEIPDLSNINLKNINDKIILFKQKVFYYKFNLALPSQNWYGSKACKFKDLKSISDLRNVKNKKYSWWRLDIIIQKDRFTNLKIVDNGGWHFSQIKEPKKIYEKNRNDEHHDAFDLIGVVENDIAHMVNNRYIIYDHTTDKRDSDKKWSKDNRIYLTKINDNKLPKYLIDNKNKYLEWFA
jgi:beta-1,4-mannosyl-glycoprotein beta-1,4-N-acetylglucosaminyltransferase